nr:uncharacterized protein LOC127328565 [Lolium perenne]
MAVTSSIVGQQNSTTSSAYSENAGMRRRGCSWCRMPALIARWTRRPRASTPRTKSCGERGSPCRNPLRCQMGGPGSRSSSRGHEAAVSSPVTRFPARPLPDRRPGCRGRSLTAALAAAAPAPPPPALDSASLPSPAVRPAPPAARPLCSSALTASPRPSPAARPLQRRSDALTVGPDLTAEPLADEQTTWPRPEPEVSSYSTIF